MFRIIVLICVLCSGVIAARPVSASNARTPEIIVGVPVTKLGDTNLADNGITLREALLIVRGGSGPKGLNRQLSADETIDLTVESSSCSVGSFNITGGCGAGIIDAIRFSPSLGANPIIYITSTLPTVNDNAMTIIDGAGITPTIDASGLIADNRALVITSNINGLISVNFTGATGYNVIVSGNSNVLGDLGSWDAGTGVYISGNSNTLQNSRIGVTSSTATTCGIGAANRGNFTNGIQIEGGDNNVVNNNIVGCTTSTGGAGISVNGTGNDIKLSKVGVNINDGGNIGNGGSGMIVLGADGSTIQNNTIANSGGIGILIGSGGHGFYSNIIRNNGSHGAYSTLNADHNTFGGLNKSNTIKANGGDGLSFFGSQIFSVTVGINVIGEIGEGNAGNGILFAGGAYDNVVMDNVIAYNLRHGVAFSGTSVSYNRIIRAGLHDNGGAGIMETGAAAFNWWEQISTYNNGGLGIDKSYTSAGPQVTAPYPVIISVTQTSPSIVSVRGRVTREIATNYKVELYRAALDASTFGEGKIYWTSVIPDAQGYWQVNLALSAISCLTAFQTETAATPGINAATSSEFAQVNCRNYLPSVRRP